MEQRVSLITLGVADLIRSKEFYERLGWRRSMAKAEGIVFFQLGGIAFSLYPRDELARDANIPSAGHGFCGITLAYNARTREEVDSVLAQAAGAGAKIVKPAEGAFWVGIRDTSPTRTASCGKSPGIRPSKLQRTEAFEFPSSQVPGGTGTLACGSLSFETSTGRSACATWSNPLWGETAEHGDAGWPARKNRPALSKSARCKLCRRMRFRPAGQR